MIILGSVDISLTQAVDDLLILDGGIEVDAISNVNFKELDFQNAT